MAGFLRWLHAGDAPIKGQKWKVSASLFALNAISLPRAANGSLWAYIIDGRMTQSGPGGACRGPYCRPSARHDPKRPTRPATLMSALERRSDEIAKMRRSSLDL